MVQIILYSGLKIAYRQKSNGQFMRLDTVCVANTHTHTHTHTHTDNR